MSSSGIFGIVLLSMFAGVGLYFVAISTGLIRVSFGL
jgi:hypothetical protein